MYTEEEIIYGIQIDSEDFIDFIFDSKCHSGCIDNKCECQDRDYEKYYEFNTYLQDKLKDLGIDIRIDLITQSCCFYDGSVYIGCYLGSNYLEALIPCERVAVEYDHVKDFLNKKKEQYQSMENEFSKRSEEVNNFLIKFFPEYKRKIYIMLNDCDKCT